MADRQTVPPLEVFLRPVLEQMDPAEGIEDEYKLKNDKAFVWKALRLMHKTDLGLDDKYQKDGIEAVALAVSGADARAEAKSGGKAEDDDAPAAADDERAADGADGGDGGGDADGADDGDGGDAVARADGYDGHTAANARAGGGAEAVVAVPMSDDEDEAVAQGADD
mmetsp:Transcript_1502/g.4918  ORF Transcript_1502/g.4918 Transcript_1502/m.4918 type:complete len:167 (-) Transcript_1502:1854-2354(-)